MHRYIDDVYSCWDNTISMDPPDQIKVKLISAQWVKAAKTSESTSMGQIYYSSWKSTLKHIQISSKFSFKLKLASLQFIFVAKLAIYIRRQLNILTVFNEFIRVHMWLVESENKPHSIDTQHTYVNSTTTMRTASHHMLHGTEHSNLGNG
jgi:hypothetical protein